MSVSLQSETKKGELFTCRAWKSFTWIRSESFLPETTRNYAFDVVYAEGGELTSQSDGIVPRKCDSVNIFGSFFAFMMRLLAMKLRKWFQERDDMTFQPPRELEQIPRSTHSFDVTHDASKHLAVSRRVCTHQRIISKSSLSIKVSRRNLIQSYISRPEMTSNEHVKQFSPFLLPSSWVQSTIKINKLKKKNCAKREPRKSHGFSPPSLVSFFRFFLYCCRSAFKSKFV